MRRSRGRAGWSWSPCRRRRSYPSCRLCDGTLFVERLEGCGSTHVSAALSHSKLYSARWRVLIRSSRPRTRAPPWQSCQRNRDSEIGRCVRELHVKWELAVRACAARPRRRRSPFSMDQSKSCLRYKHLPPCDPVRVHEGPVHRNARTVTTVRGRTRSSPLRQMVGQPRQPFFDPLRSRSIVEDETRMLFGFEARSPAAPNSSEARR